VILPDEAGIGAVPHRCAHPTSLCSRSGWSPAATSRIAAVSGPTPTRRAGRERARQRGGSRARRGGRSDLEASRLAGPAGATQNAWFSQRGRLAGDAIPRFRPTNAVVEWPAKRARTSSGPGCHQALASDCGCALASGRWVWLPATCVSPRPRRLGLSCSAAAPDWAARAALMASATSDLPCRRRACRSHLVDLDYPHVGGLRVAGQAGSVEPVPSTPTRSMAPNPPSVLSGWSTA
jgi:hypothetical protein